MYYDINSNKSPKDESFVSVSEGRRKFVRPLGGRHSREAFVRARFRRMRILYSIEFVLQVRLESHLPMSKIHLKYVYTIDITKPSEAPTI